MRVYIIQYAICKAQVQEVIIDRMSSNTHMRLPFCSVQKYCPFHVVNGLSHSISVRDDRRQLCNVCPNDSL